MVFLFFLNTSTPNHGIIRCITTVEYVASQLHHLPTLVFFPIPFDIDGLTNIVLFFSLEKVQAYWSVRYLSQPVGGEDLLRWETLCWSTRAWKEREAK